VKLVALVAVLALGIGGGQTPAKDVIVVGWIGHLGWLNEGSGEFEAEIDRVPVYFPRVFGPGRTAWNLCWWDASEGEPYTLSCSKPDGHIESWTLTVKRLKELRVPATGRYSNTHQEYYEGKLVGFDHQHPLVGIGDRLLTMKDGVWNNDQVPGYDASAKLVEVRNDATVVLKEFDDRAYAITESRMTGIRRFLLGMGHLDKAIGTGENGLLVSVESGYNEHAQLKLWDMEGATPRSIGAWNATGAVFASDGRIYRESRGGVDPTSMNKEFCGWTKLQPIEDNGSANVIQVAGDVYTSDVDLPTHQLWGVRCMVGHMGEPFIESDYLSGKQKTLLKNAVQSVGRYERVAYVENLY